MKTNYKHWDSEFIFKKYKTPDNWSKRFESERYFLKKVCKENIKILDIGCACGNLYSALKSKYKKIDYTGIDISERLIKKAKKLYPKVKFKKGNILNGLISHRKKYDLVIATGVYQHEPRYKKLLKIMLNHTKEGGYVLFDLKLFSVNKSICDIKKAYGDHGGGDIVYFIVLNINDLLKIINSHKKNINKIEIFGYITDAHTTVHLPKSVSERVVSAHVMIQKGKQTERKEIQTSFKLPNKFKKQIKEVK